MDGEDGIDGTKQCRISVRENLEFLRALAKERGYKALAQRYSEKLRVLEWYKLKGELSHG